MVDSNILTEIGRRILGTGMRVDSFELIVGRFATCLSGKDRKQEIESGKLWQVTNLPHDDLAIKSTARLNQQHGERPGRFL
jgi:hypothetical protein